MFAGKKTAQIREILISESAWEEMTCLFAPSLDMFRLKELQTIVELRRNGAAFDEELHKEIIMTLKYVANNYGISIPSHWL